MKLGLVTYCKKGELPYQKGFATHLPPKLRKFYIEKFHPYDVYETELLGIQGYEIKFFLTSEQIRQRGMVGQKLLEKMVRDVSGRGVRILIPPLQGSLPIGMLPLSNGKAVKGFFAMDAIEKVLKKQNKELKDSKIVLVDGGNFLTHLVLDRVYSKVNFLSIFTDRKEDWEEKVENIYEDCGLNVFLFSNGKNNAMSEADVILNCGCEMENYDYTIPKGAFYFDLAQNRRKLERLLARREDIFLSDGILLKKNKKIYTDCEVEGAFYAGKEQFQRFLDSRYDEVAAEEAEDFLRSQEFQLQGFTCMGKRVRP